MLVRIESRQISMCNLFHLTLIAIFLLLVFTFDVPGLSGFPKVISIGVLLSCVFRTPYDFAFEHLVAKLLLDFGTNRKLIESVFRTNAREGEVDGETLIGLFSCPSSVAACSIFSLLGADTSWTDIEDTVHVRKSWDSISMSMGIEQIVVTLMPEKSLSGGLDG